MLIVRLLSVGATQAVKEESLSAGVGRYRVATLVFSPGMPGS